MVKTKTYAPPKGGVGTNNVELSEESDADLLGQHDTTENEEIVLTEVSDNELPDETVVLRSILPDDEPSISGINTIPPLSNGPRRSLRLRKKSQANQPKGKALPTLELNGESKGDPNVESKGDSTGIYGMLKGAMQDMITQVISAIQAAVPGNFSTVGSKPIRQQKLRNRRLGRIQRKSLSSESESSDSEHPDESSDESDIDSVATSQVTHSRSQRSADHHHSMKLPPYTGQEKWEVWHNRFEAVADLRGWNKHDKLQELLPRLHGEAGDFTFDQLSKKTLGSYRKVIKELNNRFGVIETTRTYKLQFSRRKQLTGESVEKFAAELKRLYYKAYKNWDAITRQEDLLQRFVLGLNDYKARVHLELHRDPATIDDAVYEILTYMETMKNPNQLDEIKKSVRQIKNTPKDLIHGQLNGKKPVETRETEMSNPVVTGGSGEQSKTIMIKEEDLQALFHKMMGQTKQEVTTKTFQRPNAIPNTNKPPALRQDGSQRNTLLCFYCGQPGHFARKCFSNPNRQPDTNLRSNGKQQWGRQNEGSSRGPNIVPGAPQGYSLN